MSFKFFAFGLLTLLLTCSLATAGDKDSGSKKYTLRYKFRPGETLRWEVEHRAKVRTTVGGVTQTADTASDSLKVWRVKNVNGEGHATFEHLVEHVQMRHELTGRAAMTYDSEKDKTPPPGFEDAAKNVGVVLAVVTIDAQGNILKRENKQEQKAETNGPITIQLPDGAVALGESWTYPYEITVTRRDRTMKRIKSRQRFTLLGVQNGVASIKVETLILTPIHDPNVEAQLVQRETHGVVKFDLASGRVVEQLLELDKRVVGAPSGETSSMHYVMRFSEKLQDAAKGDRRSAKRVYGPQPQFKR